MKWSELKLEVEAELNRMGMEDNEIGKIDIGMSTKKILVMTGVDGQLFVTQYPLVEQK